MPSEGTLDDGNLQSSRIESKEPLKEEVSMRKAAPTHAQLEKALKEIHAIATRRKWASCLKRTLIQDLERIDYKAASVLGRL